MLPRGILRVGLWFVSLRGEAGKAAFLLELYKRDPDGVLTMWDQTCDHVLNGRDAEDHNSVGGWSQREIDLFLACLKRMGILTASPVEAYAHPAPSASLPFLNGTGR